MNIQQTPLTRGTQNLLVDCAGVRAGDQVLIVHEEAGQHYYDPALVDVVALHARRLGAHVSLKEARFDPGVTKAPPDLKARIDASDVTIFLARIGDQLRFSDVAGAGRAVVCYALDTGMLASGFGTASYGAFDIICREIDRALISAKEIHVTCRRGTNFRGRVAQNISEVANVGIRRFPMPVFAPLPAENFSGVVALPGFVVGTGSKYYEPYAREFAGAVIAHFESGRIKGFSGDKTAVDVVEAHYRRVSDQFGIDVDFIHSWHAGIHPGCGFSGRAADNYERWSGSAFGNPRVLHFHTCGAYAPGEISWNVIDPTIRIDGVKVWEDGVLHADRLEGCARVLTTYPCAKSVFDFPTKEIGV